MIREFVFCGLIIGMLAACSKSEEVVTKTDEEPVRWKLSSTYPSSLAILGTAGKRIDTQIALVSGGGIELKFYEPGVLAPPFEVFDAVSYGAIDAAWSTPGYWAGKVPALQMFGSVPFGPDAPEYLAWFDYGGGRELFEEFYHAHNIHGIICGISPPEASGWFKRELTSIEDFKGLKIRFFGLGAKVLEKEGASTQLLTGGDLLPALELGTIDGAEFSSPSVDYAMGFYQAAKHYYFPGWHQQSTFFDLMINLEAWNSLSKYRQAQIEAVCSDNIRYTLSEGEASQFESLAKLQAEGVELHKWSDKVLQALEQDWLEVAAELSASDADFKRAWSSLQAFRANYKIWRDLGYLERK